MTTNLAMRRARGITARYHAEQARGSEGIALQSPTREEQAMTAILGISAFYHDSAAALVVDGRIVAAAQEERFSRKKHDDDFPAQAIGYCLQEAGLEPGQIDWVGFYDKPYQKFDRLLETHLAYAPRGFRSFSRAIPLWMKRKLHLPRVMNERLGGAYRKRYVFAEHHESHAASAFFPSPFEEAAILTLDGVGEWATAAWGAGRGNRVELTHVQRFPHSLGLLYSAFTQYAGFEVNDGEYKLMGLAPYGEPKHVDRILENLLDLKDDGSFRLDMSYFDYGHGLTMISPKFAELFGGPPRQPGGPMTQRDKDVAASIQKVTEEIMLRAARHVRRETGLTRLCLAGGVALNCVGNGRILREGPFDDVWIQPAAGDAGGALGVALLIWHQLLENERVPSRGDSQAGSLLGDAFDDDAIEAVLRREGAVHERLPNDEALTARVADALAAGEVVGWFQGRMEFGPRALGSRSILGDARDPEMRSRINRMVKFREGFRPFAPIVLAEDATEWFDLAPGRESPYMLLVAPVAGGRRTIPAVTHVDGSARVQTVDAERFPLLHRLLVAFRERTGCPVLVNTSFNLGWDPIVRTPREAYETFMSSELDLLCVGRFLVTKRSQRAAVRQQPDGRRDEVLDDLLVSPCCGGALSRRDDAYRCATCAREFPIEDGIPRLFWPHEGMDGGGDVTEIVKAFYEETPFPNYDEHETVRSLVEKSRRGLYARRLDESIPFNSEVLEIGCGTGQLANFLGISCRRVIATDMCLHSLRLGESFRRVHGLARVRFLQMNLFCPAVAPSRFDVVICNGVLHHTSDPWGGFATLVPLVKPGGHFVLGLYNRWGRLLSGARRSVFRLTGGRARWIDPVLHRSQLDPEKSRAWFADQYRHPHESTHTAGEVLRRFDEAGLDFVRGIPALRPDDDGLAGESLFEPQPAGTRFERGVVQAMQILAPGQREGGFFVMIGRKREDAP
jgi:carbamoyltransferase